MSPKCLPNSGLACWRPQLRLLTLAFAPECIIYLGMTLLAGPHWRPDLQKVTSGECWLLEIWNEVYLVDLFVYLFGCFAVWQVRTFTFKLFISVMRGATAPETPQITCSTYSLTTSSRIPRENKGRPIGRFNCWIVSQYIQFRGCTFFRAPCAVRISM